MKTAIIYHSEHHGNTKKLLDAIAKTGDVTLIDAADCISADLSSFELIGFASGIYFQKFHQDVLDAAQQYLPQNKKVFFIHTCGIKRPSYTDAICKIAESKGAKIFGSYVCLGYDTFGPFKVIGGIAKGHPNDEDIENVLHFFKNIDK